MKLRRVVAISALTAALGALPGDLSAAASSDDWIEALRPIARGGGTLVAPPPDAASPWQGLSPGSIPVAFNPATAVLTGPARAELDRLAAALSSNELRAYEFRMDWSSVAGDRSLAEQRAKSVYDYLLQQGGLAARRLGFGKERGLETGQSMVGSEAIAVRIVNLGE